MKERDEYAKLFNTHTENVKGWNELTDKQKEQVRHFFAAEIDKLVYGRCVYEIGTDGMVLSRRPTKGRIYE